MLPPHCGQTKLMIEEMMLELDSPGSVSTLMMISYPAGPSRELLQIRNHARGKQGLRMSVNLTPVS